MLKKIRFLAPILFTVCLFIVFYFKRFIIIKYYPPIMNTFIFLIFFSSLFTKETVIQKFARLLDGELKPKVASYTKNLTIIWCVFLFINLLISIITIFMSDKIWMLYNCCIAYILIGLIFIIEYPVRIMYRRKHNL